MSTEKMKQILDTIAADPIAAMDAKIEKTDVDGKPIEEPLSLFSGEDIASNAFVEHRDSERIKHQGEVAGTTVALEDAFPGRADIERLDRAENLVENMVASTLEDMERNNLLSGDLDETPWSDDYWAIYKGILGARYADPRFPASSDWRENYEYTQENSLRSIVQRGVDAEVDELSPAEKYDLLVGDQGGTLTAAMWREGKGYYDASGSVESWMGICHGWAPASYQLGRPQRVIELVSPAGLNLRFYPSDIKGLASLLWAKARARTRFIGGRCNDKNPDKDPENGRVISPLCFDTNPGTWHLAVVNMIAAKRSFVMDATYDYEVWNQPICGYEYNYFNPSSLTQVASLADARVAVRDFTNDRFKKYRGRHAESIVGISMRVRYVAETDPSHAEADDPSKDRLIDAYYTYDLELDELGDITGGEWYNNKHPDFLWTPPPEVFAESPGEAAASGDWQDGEAIPEAWRAAARRTSAHGIPLAKIVEELVRRSRS